MPRLTRLLFAALLLALSACQSATPPSTPTLSPTAAPSSTPSPLSPSALADAQTDNVAVPALPDLNAKAPEAPAG
ncbi:MAG: hypothetical protein RMJ85_04240 [Anaerolineales bacterium]|nr:hypothetical protein [Anaerolineales bacterium]